MAEPTKEDQEKENIRVTLELADNLYKVVQDERFQNEFDADDRYKILLEKYKNFADMYPVVIRLMARDLRYNRVAFRKMLEKLLRDQKKKALEDQKMSNKRRQKQDPLAAMRAFMTHQSDYAKFLYIEESKRMGRHVDMRKANAIWNIEYQNMNKTLKKMKKDEDNARNEFEEEKEKHLEEKRKELYDFIMEEEGENAEEHESSDSDDGMTPEERETERELKELAELDSYVRDLKEARESFSNPDTMKGIDKQDLAEYSYVLEYCEMLFELAVKHERMSEEDARELMESVQFCTAAIDDEVVRRAEIVKKQKEQQDKQWLVGTSADPNYRNRAAKKKGRGRTRARK